MLIEKFIPLSPDRFIRNSKDSEVARFGHLNTLIDQLNLNSNRSFNTVAYKSDTLSTGESLTLSTDGTPFVTGLIIPDDNTVWATEITISTVCNTAGGTVSVGDAFMGKFNLLIKRVAGITSVVGVNSASTTYDSSLSTATVSFSVGINNNFEINFNAPTTATNTGFKVVGVISVTQTSIK